MKGRSSRREGKRGRKRGRRGGAETSVRETAWWREGGGGGEEESAMKMWKSGGERLRSEMRARRAGEEGVRRGEGKGEGKKKD